jgi:RNA polymerase sigma factor (sigma-70 family)
MTPRTSSAELRRVVAAACAGDERAWAEIVSRFEGVVRAATAAFRLSPADAEDAAQAVWLRLVEDIARVRDPAALAGWLSTAARRECMRLKTRSLRDEPTDPAELPEAASADEPVAAVVATERRTALRRAVATLPPRQRDVITLLAAEPTPSYERIAEQLGMPIGSVGPTRRRATERLQRHGRLAELGEAR